MFPVIGAVAAAAALGLWAIDAAIDPGAATLGTVAKLALCLLLAAGAVGLVAAHPAFSGRRREPAVRWLSIIGGVVISALAVGVRQPLAYPIAAVAALVLGLVAGLRQHPG